jgi:hypothetical protein
MRRHLVDEALDLALRQIARRLLALGRKWYGTRGIELNAFVRNCRSQALPQSEDGLPSSGCGQPRTQKR